MRLFVLAKDGSGLRMLVIHHEVDEAQKAVETARGQGLETTTVCGFDLADVMRSHPAWFRTGAPA